MGRPHRGWDYGFGGAGFSLIGRSRSHVMDRADLPFASEYATIQILPSARNFPPSSNRPDSRQLIEADLTGLISPGSRPSCNKIVPVEYVGRPLPSGAVFPSRSRPESPSPATITGHSLAVVAITRGVASAMTRPARSCGVHAIPGANQHQRCRADLLLQHQ